MKRKWDIASEEARKKCSDEIITRIEEIGDGAVGVIAAQDIIDIVTENLGPQIYNNGIRDAKKLVLERLQDVEFELDGLEQRT